MSIAWGDGTSSGGIISEDDGSGTAYGSHAYTSPGAYYVTVTITDDDSGVATSVSTKTVVVYATNSTGFVTGGGDIDSPSGSYTPANTHDSNGHGKALRVRREVRARVAHADGQHGVPAPSPQGSERPR